MFAHKTFQPAARTLIDAKCPGVVIQRRIGDFSHKTLFFAEMHDSFPVYVRPASAASSVCIRNVWTRVPLSFAIDSLSVDIERIINDVILRASRYFRDPDGQQTDIRSFACNVYKKPGGFLLVFPTIVTSLHIVHKIIPTLVRGVSSHWSGSFPCFKFHLPVAAKSSHEQSSAPVFSTTLYFSRFVIGCHNKQIPPLVVFIRDYSTSDVEPLAFPFVFSDGFCT